MNKQKHRAYLNLIALFVFYCQACLLKSQWRTKITVAITDRGMQKSTKCLIIIAYGEAYGDVTEEELSETIRPVGNSSHGQSWRLLNTITGYPERY